MVALRQTVPPTYGAALLAGVGTAEPTGAGVWPTGVGAGVRSGRRLAAGVELCCGLRLGGGPGGQNWPGGQACGCFGWLARTIIATRTITPMSAPTKTATTAVPPPRAAC